jgi:hypothetical protein
MPSEGVDNAGVFQGAEIHRGDENQGMSIRIGDRILQFAVHLDADFFARLSTFALNLEVQRFVAELPLHEGRRDGVDRSSSVDLFTCAKCHPVRRWHHRDRIRPNNGAILITIEEGQILFQYIQN